MRGHDWPSGIAKVFPQCAEVLWHPEIVMEGTGLKIHNGAEAYRAAISKVILVCRY